MKRAREKKTHHASGALASRCSSCRRDRGEYRPLRWNLSVLEVMMMRGGDGNFLLLSSFYDVSFSFLFPFEGLFAPKTLKNEKREKCPHG